VIIANLRFFLRDDRNAEGEIWLSENDPNFQSTFTVDIRKYKQGLITDYYSQMTLSS